MRRIILALLAAAVAAAAPTQIRDTGYTGFSGTLFAGRMTISAPDVTTSDGRTVHRWEQSYVITGGIIAVDLEPNDTATPAGTSYTVIYRPKSGQAWSERWVVPTSATSLRVNQVRVLRAPTVNLTILPQQIAPAGATSGQVLGFNGSSWGPTTGGGQAVWGQIAGTLANQTDLNNALAAKAALSHVHLVEDVTGLQPALDSKADAMATTSALAGKANLSHVHLVGEVTGLQAALDNKAASTHGHAMGDVANLQPALDSKAATNHAHAIGDTSGLQTALDSKTDATETTIALAGKANLSHVHVIGDTTGLQAAIDGKAPSTHNHDALYAALSHVHLVGDVTGLQAALDGKAASTHGHAIGDTTGLQAALDAKAASAHGHAIADVANLQTALDGKIGGTGTTGTVPYFSGSTALASTGMTWDSSTKEYSVPLGADGYFRLGRTTGSIPATHWITVRPQTTAGWVNWQFLDNSGTVTSYISGPDGSYGNKYVLNNFVIAGQAGSMACSLYYARSFASDLTDPNWCGPIASGYGQIVQLLYAFHVQAAGSGTVTFTVTWSSYQPGGSGITKTQTLGTINAANGAGDIITGSVAMFIHPNTKVQLSTTHASVSGSPTWTTRSFLVIPQ